MRTEQFRLYQMSMKSVGIMFDVVPFYLTWFVLGIVFLKEDVRHFSQLRHVFRDAKPSCSSLYCVLSWESSKGTQC